MTFEGDEALLSLNESELLWMARLQGLPTLRRELPHEELVAIVSGRMEPGQQHIAGTAYTREKLESFITKNFDILRGQLPGCDGKCRTFRCTEGKHISCFVPNEAHLLL